MVQGEPGAPEPVASKNVLHPQNLKKENMRKWKTVSKQVN